MGLSCTGDCTFQDKDRVHHHHVNNDWVKVCVSGVTEVCESYSCKCFGGQKLGSTISIQSPCLGLSRSQIDATTALVACPNQINTPFVVSATITTIPYCEFGSREQFYSCTSKNYLLVEHGRKAGLASHTDETRKEWFTKPIPTDSSMG